MSSGVGRPAGSAHRVRIDCDLLPADVLARASIGARHAASRVPPADRHSGCMTARTRRDRRSDHGSAAARREGPGGGRAGDHRRHVIGGPAATAAHAPAGPRDERARGPSWRAACVRGSPSVPVILARSSTAAHDRHASVAAIEDDRDSVGSFSVARRSAVMNIVLWIARRHPRCRRTSPRVRNKLLESKAQLETNANFGVDAGLFARRAPRRSAPPRCWAQSG